MYVCIYIYIHTYIQFVYYICLDSCVYIYTYIYIGVHDYGHRHRRHLRLPELLEAERPPDRRRTFRLYIGGDHWTY